MATQHISDKPGGTVFTAYIGISRRGGAREPEDKGEIFFILTKFRAQGVFAFF
jgi:hypothetical protein